MSISRTTRTHLIYQFIILTVLFLAIGYNELLPGRKFILFMAFIPMFCYQLLILSCCMELMPVPKWMNLGESAKKTEKKKMPTDSMPNSPESSHKISSEAENTTEFLEFSDVSDKLHCPRRWEKSVVNLGASPKIATYPQKSKSWMNLSDSSKLVLEKSLSREGSLDGLAPLSEIQLRKSHPSKADRLHCREERSIKAKSWKPNVPEFDTADTITGITQRTEASPKGKFKRPLQRVSSVQKEESELGKSYSFPFRVKRQSAEQLSPSKPCFSSIAKTEQNDLLSTVQQEECELPKSYSFPFRQKRLETWLEMKETKESNQSLDMPYWQTVGYSLAVKYEARRRRRAVSSPTKKETDKEMYFHKSLEIPKNSTNTSKQSQKKTVKSTSNCIHKLKTSFSNFISKKKDEGSENISSNKTLKPSLSFKSKNKNFQRQSKQEVDVPPMPQFLSNDRPLLFYPKYIPFEKERFESDVQSKMLELAGEQKSELKCMEPK